MVTILCADKLSSYHSLDNIDIWTESRNAMNYNGSSPVICHPPCAQFSKTRNLAKYQPDHLALARHCYNMIMLNGGILEQPAYSIMFDWLGIKPTIEIDQRWFGLNYRKLTWLYFHDCTPIAHPLNFSPAPKKQSQITSSMRARQPIALSQWLINCINETL